MPANLDISSLISGLPDDQPKLAQILEEINSRLHRVEKDLFPLVQQSQIIVATAAAIGPPTVFVYQFLTLGIRFSWTADAAASSYEVRQGVDWDTASFIVRTNSLSADIDPIVTGSYNFLIKSLDAAGNYSGTANSVLVLVPSVGPISVSARTLDNNILLNWTTPTAAYAIDHFNVWRDNSIIGTTKGNFTVYFELIAGTYVYSISAVDAAGNESAKYGVTVTLSIPADFVLESVWTSPLGIVSIGSDFYYLQVVTGLGDSNFRYDLQPGFPGTPDFNYAFMAYTFTLSDVVAEPGPKLLACWTPTTFQAHFTGNSWLTPKNQMDAGFPIYIEPAALTGYYEEIIDYVGTFDNIIVTITYVAFPVTLDPVSIVVKMAGSTDGISYSPLNAGASQFFQAIRYLKFRLEFTGASTKALVEVSNVVVALNVKKELDSGNVTALATDALGTDVLFNKPFKDVESITLAVNSKEPVYAIYDFTDVPNPTGFKVFALDSSGNRITYPVSWKARGLI